MTMPPLPVSAANFYPGVSSNEWVPGYTPAQMRDYARAAIAAHAGNIAAVPAQPVAWLSGDGHPHHISALQTITERRIHGPWQPLYAAPQAVPVPADMALTDDPWRKLYRRAINEANGLTNYVEDRPELRGAERRLAAIEAEARTLAATFEPTPEKKP